MQTEGSPQFVPDSEQISEEPEELKEEKTKRERLIRHYVEGRVIALEADANTEDLSDEFSGFSTAQKSDLLYEKLMARWNTLQEMRKAQESGAEAEPIDPYLIAEIKTLWDDEATAENFCSRFADARIDAKLYRLSELGNRYQKLNDTIAQREEEFENVSQNLFLRRVSRPDQLSASRGKAERLAKELIRLRTERDEITELEGLPPIPENTSIAAHIAYERLVEYRQQAQKGFVWLDSRVDIHHQTMAALQNGRWPVLVGEAGSGKSEQADAAASALTGQDPTHLACSERTSERDMISDKEIDPETGGSFDAFGPVMQAATGFEDSRQTNPAFGSGRIVRFDESGRLGSQGYAIIKELRQKHPGDSLFNKPVLPGFGSIWTTNPVGPRYPDRNEPDPAMRRELAYIDVDYPPQTDKNPELYEFMLANLMDENGHITVSKAELSPAYELKDIDPPQTLGQYISHHFAGQFTPEELSNLNAADPRLVSGQEKVIEDPTDPKHGTLWRLAFAVRSLQNAFDYGNAEDIPDDALKFTTDSDGKIEVSASGEPLTLTTSTITLGEVASWMKGFLDRRLKDNPDFQTDNLTDWLSFKLENYLKQADAQDTGKIRAIFEYFHLFDPSRGSGQNEPLTPREIGYLSPRVPRPLHLKHPKPESEAVVAEEKLPEPQPEVQLNTATELMLEDGSKVLVKAESISFDRDGQTTHLYPGSVFKLHGIKARFKGVVDDSDPNSGHHGQPVIETDIHTGGGLHRIVELSEIAENGEDFWSLEKITPELIEQQLSEWQTVYENLGPDTITLPTKEQLLAYLSESPEFIELLKTKEAQDFTRMVIAPVGLKDLIDKLDTRIRALGGTERYLSSVWEGMLGDEDKIHYLATIENNQPKFGHTLKEMLERPEDFGILNNCVISFVKDRLNLPKSGDADEIDSTGRAEIKGGKTAQAYLDAHFSGRDPHYEGEQAMLPQEWLALFASDIYGKYFKEGKRMDSSVTDLMDTQTATWFTSTFFPGRDALPFADWRSGVRYLGFGDRRPGDTCGDLAPRPSVRKPLKT